MKGRLHGKSRFWFWNPCLDFPNKTWNPKKGFCLKCDPPFRYAKFVFGFHVLLGNPKSRFQNPNTDFPIKNTRKPFSVKITFNLLFTGSQEGFVSISLTKTSLDKLYISQEKLRDLEKKIQELNQTFDLLQRGKNGKIFNRDYMWDYTSVLDKQAKNRL